MRLFLILLGPLLLALAIVGFLSLTRGTPVKMVVTEGDEGPPPPTDSLFERTMELFTGTHISPDNTVEQLLNGDETFPRLWQDLRAAQSTITVQMYYSLPGNVSDTMAAILKERARAGVRTLFLLDGFGSLRMPRSWVESLREAGVEVEVIRKLKWYTLHHATDRPHARAVVIDGRIGYTGGFGLADYWLGDGRQHGQWRETNVRFTGPAVMQLQSAFASAWAETRGELLTGELFFPRSGFQPTGTVHAGLMYTAPTAGSTPGERFFALTIAGARHRLILRPGHRLPETPPARRGARRRRAHSDGWPKDGHQDHAVRRSISVRRVACRGHPDIRVPTVHDACEKSRGGRHLVRDRLDELRQPFDGVQHGNQTRRA
jgi:cardiolipin synthase A/B